MEERKARGLPLFAAKKEKKRERRFSLLPEALQSSRDTRASGLAEPHDCSGVLQRCAKQNVCHLLVPNTKKSIYTEYTEFSVYSYTV